MIPVGFFDGVTQGEDMNCGAGDIIKVKEEGIFHIICNCGKGTNTHGALLALWVLLWDAKRFHVDGIQITGDSKAIIEWITNKSRLQVLSLEF